ncbi:metallophosphoesterase family protein [Candidatus Latescibacterota bacterium]
MSNENKNRKICKSTSRREFIKTSAFFTAAASLAGKAGDAYGSEQKRGASRNLLYSSDFIPKGALCKIVFVADHHYWPNHLKNWGGGTTQVRHTEERMQDLVVTLNNEAPDISIHGGDVVNAGSAYEPPFEEYIRELDFAKEMIDGLNHPAVYTIGNHDTPDLLHDSESELKHWKERFGPPYRYNDIKGWRLVSLNVMIPNPDNKLVMSNRFGSTYGIDSTQMVWLKDVLEDAASKKLNVLLFGHIPPADLANKVEFKKVIAAPGCAKGMFCGHHHNNHLSYFGGIPVMVRVGNSMSPMGYTLIYPYSDGRILVVQKSQYFPHIDYVSNSIRSGAQGSECDRFFTIGGSSALPLDGLTVCGKKSSAFIDDGHLTLDSTESKGTVLIDRPGLSNVRLSFSAVKEGGTRMGALAFAHEDGSGGIEGALTNQYSTDGNVYLADYTGPRKEILDRTWFNINDGIAYKFILEARNDTITMSVKNMPEISATLKRKSSGKFGFFVDKGKMLVTDLKLEKLDG